MAKKNFKVPFDTLLGENRIERKTNDKEIRATFIIQKSQLDKLRALAFWEKKMLKDILRESLSSYIDLYESKNGILKLPE